jgi:hypothetical protein
VDRKAQFSHKVIYGKSRFYPQNETARAIAELCRLETFWKEDLAKIQALGFEVELVSVSLDQFLADEKRKDKAKKVWVKKSDGAE